jgi:2-methylcitrate dehydratase PrpD
MISLSERISEYLCQLRLERIPSEKIHDIKCLILDYLGVALRGSRTMSGRIAIQYALNQNSQPASTIIGVKTQASPELAAFANAISSHSIELDDVDDLALFHYSPSIVSAALAVAEKLKSSGRDLVRAIYAGCEMTARLSNAMNPSLRNRGFHTTPVCGCIGASVSVGLLLELNQHEMANAIALAGSQSCGLMEFYGDSLQKRFNTGPPARNGICAAEMANLGFSGADEIIEGRRGFFRAFADDHNEAAFLDGLGEKFPVHIDFKPYASARPIHNGIDCALEIRTKYSVASQDIQKITIYRHPAWADYHLIYNPKNINEAQVSLPFSAAVAFKEGDAFLDHYEDPYLSDPEINRIMNAVRVEPMEKLPRGVSCLMVVETTSGDKYHSQIDYPKGSRQNPITEKELIKKFKKLSSNLNDSTSGDRIAEMIFNLDDLKNLSDLTIYFRVGS